MRDGHLRQESYAKKIYAQTVGAQDGKGILMSAIQITTRRRPICAMCDMLGRRPSCRKKGFVRQEEAALPDFLANRFGGLLWPEAK